MSLGLGLGLRGPGTGGIGSGSANVFDFAWITDPHWGRSTYDPGEPLDALNRIGSAHSGISFVVLSGDVSDNALQAEIDAFIADRAASSIASKDWYESPGNHDEKENSDASGGTADGPADYIFYDAAGLPRRGAWTHGTYRFIMFASFVRREPDALHGFADVSATDLTFLQDELEALLGTNLIPIVFTHYGLLSLLGNYIRGTAQTTIQNLLALHNVPFYGHGHRHAFVLQKYGGASDGGNGTTHFNGECMAYCSAPNLVGAYNIVSVNGYDWTVNSYLRESPWTLLRTETLTISPDRTRPTVLSATIDAAGTSLTIVYSEACTFGAGGNGGWAITPSGGAATLAYSSGDTTATHVHTISRQIAQSETATGAYTNPTTGHGTQDSAGNNLATFSGLSVTNSSTYVPPTYSSSVLDGNDRITRGADLTGNADGKVGLISFWFKAVAATGGHVMGNTNQRFIANVLTTLTIDAYNGAAVQILRIRGNADYRDDAWHHLMASWDLSNVAKRHLYLDGASALTVVTYTDDTIDYTRTEWAVGSRGDASGQFTGKLTEVFFALEYLDLSNSANRLKFRTAGGAPEDLGATGSTPTGTQPIIFTLHNQVPTAHVNLGSGGGFTQQGVLVDGGADKP